MLARLLENVTCALATSHESGSDANLSVVSTRIRCASGRGVVGEATDLTPGHSIDFPVTTTSGGRYPLQREQLYRLSRSAEHRCFVDCGQRRYCNGDRSDEYARRRVGLAPRRSKRQSCLGTASAGASGSVAPQLSNAVDELSVRGHGH